MASIMEDFIETLDKEDLAYRRLLEISKRKTPVIVKGDTGELTRITEEEQKVVDEISHLDKHRIEVISDMATVLNKDVQILKIPYIIDILQKQPVEAERLKAVYERLKVTVKDMKAVNEQNKRLIELSLDMVQFDISILQAAKNGPETGDYNRSGSYTDSGMIAGGPRFDSKS